MSKIFLINGISSEEEHLHCCHTHMIYIQQFEMGRGPLLERRLRLDKMKKVEKQKSGIMVNNAYCAFIVCPSNLKLRSAGCGLPVKFLVKNIGFLREKIFREEQY